MKPLKFRSIGLPYRPVDIGLFLGNELELRLNVRASNLETLLSDTLYSQYTRYAGLLSLANPRHALTITGFLP